VLLAARRRLALIASVSLLGLLAIGCGDVREQTQWSADRTNGVSATAGDIGIRNALVVADEAGRQATVFATFANSGSSADELVAVRVGDRDAEPDSGPLEIPANGFATVAPDATRLDVTGAQAQPGQRVELEFIFADAPRATVSALVQADAGIYAGALD
jgi:copper(I)-binding protein